ncbi:hypothetical protein L9G74_06835 [Shewanella sp. C32]|uniref:HEAT repeat domain-containing protein n=1 Tax=Shewanella electrica TaxID=515560 RepID=A0ABT2FIR2_9GAMM|nr:hypothetical protein [Shewanella electrica]MCH1924245.1 hypothetical protein [Shewanella electrica]MCS4556148.1 hypothetical protein [Shewanella electrica]
MNNLMKFSLIALSFFGVILISASANAVELADEDVIAMTQQLEQRPLAPEADDLRQQLYEWTTDSDEVQISVCDVLGPIPSHEEIPYAKELLVQSFFGNAAYQLQHPASKNDQLKLQLAGITSMLKAYRNIIKQQPEARIATYDAWLKALDSDKLARQLLPTIAQKCLSDDPQQNQFAVLR